jgi:hypothetical protein
VRYAPNPDAEDLVNIGVIVVRDGGEWVIVQWSDTTRDRTFGARSSHGAAADWLRRVPQLIRGRVALEAWLLDAHQRHRSEVQLGEPLSVIADNITEALGILLPGLRPPSVDETAEPESVPHVPCPEGFHWIGQSFESCDQCGLPADMHAGWAIPTSDSPMGDTQFELRPWDQP